MADLTDRIYLQVLVVRCQVGDRAAFAELVGVCQPRLRAFLLKMLPKAQMAEDVAQEIWVDIFRDLSSLIDPAAFLSWLYRIAHNRCARAMRGRKRSFSSIDEIEISEPQQEIEFTPEDAAAVQAALDQISPQHREVLLLRFLEDMSYEQIAVAVGCPVGTVRSRIHNAKAALRGILQATMT